MKYSINILEAIKNIKAKYSYFQIDDFLLQNFAIHCSNLSDAEQINKYIYNYTELKCLFTEIYFGNNIQNYIEGLTANFTYDEIDEFIFLFVESTEEISYNRDFEQYDCIKAFIKAIYSESNLITA